MELRPGQLKQSFCYPLFQDKGQSLDDLFALAREIGYAATELLGWDESLASIVEAARRQHLAVASISGHGSIDDGLNDPTQHDRIEEELKRSIEAAARYGIPGVICFSGTRRPGVSDIEGLAIAVKGIRRVTALAEQKGVNLNLEILNSRVDHPGYMADTVDWGIAFCEAANSPRCRLLFDVYHVQIMEGDVIRGLRRAAPYLGHLHTAGNPGRNELDDHQELNYRGICNALVELGYDGYIGHELIVKRQSRAEALRSSFVACTV